MANTDALSDAEPEMPGALDDRAADVWEPLCAIADLAGSSWPERAREAALALSTGDTREDDSIGVQLLAHTRQIFSERGCERLPSSGLVEALTSMEEAPWSDVRGKPLDQNKLAKYLKVYGVKPKALRFENKTLRGYERAGFEDVWDRYIPSPAGGRNGALSVNSPLLQHILDLGFELAE